MVEILEIVRIQDTKRSVESNTKLLSKEWGGIVLLGGWIIGGYLFQRA
jgi:hypothetical protein